MSSSSVSRILFIITTSTILLVLSKSAYASPSSLIKAACATTNRDNFNVAACTTLLTQDKKAASAKNFVELSAAIMKLAIASTTRTREYMIQKLNANDPKVNLHVLGQCKLSYDSAIANIQGALSELKDDAMSSTYDLSLASNDSMQPCLAAIQAAGAGFSDGVLMSGNTELFTFVPAAIAAANNIE